MEGEAMRGAVACAMLVLTLLSARAADAPGSFAAGNQAYEQGKFAEATRHYRTVITNGANGSGVWFNLGNAAFKSGELGHAIAAYRRAEQITPRDSDLRANLHFVRKKATGEDNPSVSTMRQVIRLCTFNEWATLASVAVAAAFMFLAWGELRKTRNIGPVSSAIVLALLLVSAGAASYRDRFVRPSGVIIAKQAAVHFGPLEDSQTAFQLNDGAEIDVTDSTPDWLQIRDPRGRTGWTKRAGVALVSP
jgi:tetratricopeptide (TPR) repeat protein